MITITILMIMIMMMMLMMIIGKVKSGWNKRAYSDDNGHSCLSQSPDKNSYFCILGERIKHWTCSFTNKCRWLNEKKGLSPEKRKLFVINGGCLYSGVRETIFFPSKGYITITLNRIQGKGKINEGHVETSCVLTILVDIVVVITVLDR